MEWKPLAKAGVRVHRGPRFLRKEWKAGRLRGVCIGGRKEVYTTDEWLDEWMLDQATPIVMPARRRA